MMAGFGDKLKGSMEKAKDAAVDEVKDGFTDDKSKKDNKDKKS